MKEELKTYFARVLFPCVGGTGDLIKKADHEQIIATLARENADLRMRVRDARNSLALTTVEIRRRDDIDEANE